MILDFANMSASKSNTSLYFVYLQAQWFWLWWPPQQHLIPLSMATTQRVNTITEAMHLDTRLHNLRWHYSDIFVRNTNYQATLSAFGVLNSSLLCSLVIIRSPGTWATLNRHLWPVLRLSCRSGWLRPLAESPGITPQTAERRCLSV